MNPLPVVHPIVSAGDGSLLLNGLPKISRMFSNSNWAEKSRIDASPCVFIHLKPVVQAHEEGLGLQWDNRVFFFRPTPSWLPPGRPTRSIACSKLGLIG